MYIENKNNKKFLTKKVFGKKVSVSFDGEINDEIIEKLTQKEIELIKNSKKYQDFKQNIYNLNTLENIIFNSKFIYNKFNLTTKKDKINYFSKINFIQKFVYESNRTEGSKIKQDDIFRIFENKKINYQNKNEILEVKNSKKAFLFMVEKFTFNIENIKKVYHILTKNLVMNSLDKYPRGFKKIENTVNNDITSKPENIEKDLENLILWYKQNKKNICPLGVAYLFHLKFEKIHPFVDGNGRIGRFLINKILIDNNYFPIILFSDNKKSFFNSIKNPGVNNKKYYKTMLEQHLKTIEYFKKN